MDEFNILIPFLISALLGLVVGGYYLYSSLKHGQSETNQFKLFQKLVTELESATLIANRLGLKHKEMKDDKWLANYETNLRMLENIMDSAKKINPKSGDRYTLRSLFMLTKECNKRFRRNMKSFTASQKGGLKEFLQSTKAVEFPTGCYFCSKPFDIIAFKIVKVKVDGKLVKPYACSTCREQLNQKKKIKVLHFMHEGEPVHWSQLPGYLPEQHFFSLNSPFSKHKKPVLALVYSKKDGNNESPQV